jgi:two-component system sensor histidine kinase YesM
MEDNGSGIDCDKLELIRQNLADDGELSENIGLCNVYRRLKLYYGSEVKFEIASKLRLGTKVSLSIPVNRKQPLVMLQRGGNHEP